MGDSVDNCVIQELSNDLKKLVSGGNRHVVVPSSVDSVAIILVVRDLLFRNGM